MQNKSTILKVGLAAMTCLLTASCSDFFNPEKSGGAAGGNNNNGAQNNPGELPAEFQKPNEGAFTEQKMLINIGTNVILRSVENLSAQVPVLKNSLRQYCEALSSGSTATREEDQVKADWERTMLSFHEVATAPIGPLLDDGRAINDYVYSWPYLNTCAIDKNVLENANSPITLGNQIFNTRGLYAIEYLLFENSLNTTCNLRANPALKDWNERADLQKKLDRCQWASELVKDVEVKTTALKSKWAVEQGNFTRTMINNSRYPSSKEAINALTDSLAAIETLKDHKLGKPLGRHKECTTDTCAKNVEHLYSGLSLASAEAQLKAFRAVFTGSYSNQPAFGFDDLLARSGRDDVAQKMIVAIDKALASVRAAQNNGSLFDQIEAVDPVLCKASTMSDRKAEICAVHADVRDVAFLLKTEVLAALALRAPPSHQGDND